jgi:fumarate reductase subunit D
VERTTPEAHPLATEARQVVEKAFVEVKPWLAAFGRFGYAAKAIVYLAVGVLALAAALGAGGIVTDAAGALWAIARQPLGRLLIFVVAVGLVGHSSLRLVQGLLDPERRGRRLPIVLVRIGETLTGLGHGLLAWGAFRLFLGTGGPATGDVATRTWSGEMLAMPYGDRLLGAVAIGVIAFGLSLLVRAVVTKNICCDLALDDVPPYGCRFISAVIRTGLAAQGSLFTSVGWFALRAALDRQPREARGPAGVISHFGQRPHGELILAAFAVGLLAVAASCFIDAWWRKFPRA